MRTPITRLERSVGAFLLVVALLGMAALVGAARRVDFFDMFREGFILYAVAEDGFGVAVGSPVRLHGVEVGSVTDLALVKDPAHPGKTVRLTIRVQDRSASVLGDRTVAVIVEPPMGAGAPPFGTASVDLHPSGDHPLARRSVIDATGQEAMVQALARMTRDVSTMSDGLARSIGEMSATFAGLRTVTDALTSGKGVAGRLLHDERLADDLEATMREARVATGEARDLLASVQAIAQRTGGVMDDAQAMTQSGKQAMAKLDAALDTLPRLLASTERTLGASEDLLKSLRGAAASAPDLLRKVDSSLDETNRLVEAAQHSLIFRGNLPDRPALRTESEVRPPLALPGSPAAPHRDGSPP